MPNKKNYQQLQSELDTILDWFARATGVSLDDAIANYKKGSLIINELRVQLETAKNQIKEIDI